MTLTMSHSLAWLAFPSRRDSDYSSLSTSDQAEGALKVCGTYTQFIIILLCCIKSKACNLQRRFLLPDVTIQFSFFKGQTLWKELLEGRVMLKRLTNPSFSLCIFYKVLNLFEKICLCGYFVALFNHISFSCFRNNCLTLILKIF